MIRAQLGRLPLLPVAISFCLAGAPAQAGETGKPAAPASKSKTKAAPGKSKSKASKKGDAKGKAGVAGPEDKAFKDRFANLLGQSKGPIAIRMKPSDDPMTLPADALPPGLVLVAGTRSGIYTPPVLSPDDMLSVVNEHMTIMRKCYKKQLSEDPEWEAEMILDLSVKKTGRISEVSITPGRVERDVIGQCLLSEIPKWKFPEFTGELDDGMQQEVVNASFPFAFSAPR